MMDHQFPWVGADLMNHAEMPAPVSIRRVARAPWLVDGINSKF